MDRTENTFTRIQENVARIRQRIADAAARSGRTSDDVQLVAVTKYVAPEIARLLVQSGCLDLGESRPQELWRKHELLQDTEVRWHLIGHLQRNKARRTLPMLTLFQACDSRRLMQEVQKASEQLGTTARVLVEVNISGDADKHGFSAAEVPGVLDEIAGLNNIEVRGLMAMASLHGGLTRARANFADLRNLRDDLQRNGPTSIELAEISMGMSRDYEVAIEEGATIVRVGSALFEGLEDHD